MTAKLIRIDVVSQEGSVYSDHAKMVNLRGSEGELGIYPAVDPLDSTSRQLDPLVVGQEHYEVARSVQQTLQRYKELNELIFF